MNFEAVIGLEIHLEMKTKSKMFSSAPVSFGDKPNTNVAPLDMAFPGSLPTVNKQAVIEAIRLCNALHMQIDDELWFDRKNYFYSDLAKGYQITQHRRPIGKDGFLEIKLNDGVKTIRVERLHIEEDTCKQVHSKDYTYLDYNRSGIPLVEIVSCPDIKSGEEALKFVEKIRSIASFLGVSDGKMEEGSLRCDVNISIRPIGSSLFGKKVEIKNINTLTNIQRAIDFEIKRQQALLLSGEVIKQDTRRYDESLRQTISMREKTDSIDYKFYTDPNLPPIKLSKEFIEDAIKSSPELPEMRFERYLSMGLSEYDSGLLVNDKATCEYFDAMVNSGANYKLAANWLLVDVRTVIKLQNITIDKFNVTPDNMAKLISLIEKGMISNTQAREVFAKMQEKNEDADLIINKLGIGLISDDKKLLEYINIVLNDNQKAIIDYKNGKNRVIGLLVGQVIKLSGGKANPKLTSDLIIKELKER